MVYTKAKKIYGKYYPRKDYRVADLGIHYKMWFHYHSTSRLKYYRKQGSKSLRRYRGDVGDNGWYKKYYDVMWSAF